MATIKWLVGSGTWNTAAKWSPNSVPGPTDDAVVDAAGSYTVTIDAPAIDVGSITISDSSASLVANNGQTETVVGDLTNGGSLGVDNGGGQGGTTLSIGGTLTNSNFLQVGNNNLATTVTAQGLSNTGRIGIDGGTSSSQEALLNVTNAGAPSTWLGTLNVSGYGLLEFAGTSGISSIASGAQINLFTSQGFVAAAGLGTSSNTALAGLSSNAGQLLLQSGTTLSTTSGLNNSGTIYVNNGGLGGASLSIGGTLTNSNFLQVGNNNLATTVTAQGLSNTGRIDIDGGASSSSQEALLNVTNAGAPSTWVGTLNVSGYGLLEFAGTSGISSIASGAQINLFTSQGFVAAAGLGTSSNTALAGLSSNAGQLQLQSGTTLSTTSGLNNSGTIYVNNGGLGGASLSIGGTLTNSNFLQVGNNNLATTVTAQGLSNTGRIDIDGDRDRHSQRRWVLQYRADALIRATAASVGARHASPSFHILCCAYPGDAGAPPTVGAGFKPAPTSCTRHPCIRL
jgi:hypothetical protein